MPRLVGAALVLESCSAVAREDEEDEEDEGVEEAHANTCWVVPAPARTCRHERQQEEVY